MSKTFSCLTMGDGGRWGNQLFAYCFAKGFAEANNAKLLIPKDWIGREIFNISEDISDDLPNDKIVKTYLDHIPSESDIKDIAKYGMVIDLFGYYQFDEALKFYSRSKVKEWLRPNTKWQSMIDENKRKMGFYGVIHKRRGDYLSPYNLTKYCSITDASYDKCIKDYGLDRYKFYEITDAKVDYDIMDYDGFKGTKFEFLPDFFSIMNANVILRANSSFSFWAAALSDAQIFSPVVEDRVGWNDVEFVQGNHPRCADSRIHVGSRLTDLYLK